MTIAKRISCIFLVLVLCFSVCFQCAVTSHAVFGVDDALLIGAICLDLAACGVTIYSVSQFVQSDTFADFTHQLGADIDEKISLVKRNGELFFATSKLGWFMITNWVKNHFSGATEDRTIEFETSASTSPEFVILADGTTVPWGPFMENPFFIYRGGTSGNIFCYWCTGNPEDTGITIATRLITMYSVGQKQNGFAKIVNGQWQADSPTNMRTGATVKGQAGCQTVLQFDQNTHPERDGFFLFRTIEVWVTAAQGEINPNFGDPDVIQDGSASATAQVDMHSDGLKYPGAVDSPTTTIKDGEKVLVKVPEGMVVDDGTGNPTLTTNAETVGQVIADTTVAEVDAKVLTTELTDAEIVDQIIEDTPVQEISGNAQADIETANKFRLPKSFLEGFPFSIPYSIFVGIKSFVAEPQAPVFDLPFVINRLGINETVNIDLNRFSPLARLCRSFLSIVWVVGLALGSYKLIKH